MFKHFLLSLALLLSGLCLAQVGIGTANVSDGAILQLESTSKAFVLPRMTDSQMLTIASPLSGFLVFNTSENLPYFKENAGWTSFNLSSNPNIIINRSGGTFPVAPLATTASFPLGLTSANIVSNSAAYFSLVSTGAIKVQRSGIYLINASISSSALTAGNRKYFLALYINNNLIAYLSKSLVEQPTLDYWGTTGTCMYPAEAGDIISVRYSIDHRATNLPNMFQNICITKLR